MLRHLCQRRAATRLAFLLAVLLLPAAPASAQLVPATDISPFGPTNLRCAGVPVPAADDPSQVVTWQWEAVQGAVVTGDQEGPRGLALDSACNLYVANAQLHKILKMNPAGQVVAQWGSQGRAPGQFYYPSGVAVDNAGNVYVADTGNDRIQKLSPNGDSLAVWGACLAGSEPCFNGPGRQSGEFAGPEGIAVDGAGYVYVADTRNNRIQKLNGASGEVVGIWGFAGTGPGQFRSPSGIALDSSGNVYVADGENNRIQKLAPDGSVLFQWAGELGAGRGQFRFARGVAVDANGYVYASDANNHRVEEFAPDGTFVQSWGRCNDPATCRFPVRGANAGEFFYPRSLVADGLGDVYVADTGNDRVQRLVPKVSPLPDSAPPAS